MSLLRKKVWWQTVMGSRFTLAVLLVLITALAVSVYDRYTIEREMAERRIEKEAELQSLKERKDTLEAKVEYLNDERGVEAEIRQHFDVAKEGEQVIILVDKEEKSTIEPIPVDENDSGDESFWSHWLPW